MYIVFDAECFKNRIKVLCAYFVEKSIQKVYTESDIIQFSKLGDGKNKFIGFNIFDFDYKMMQRYFDTTNFLANSLDLLKEVTKSAGRGYSLDKLAGATLGLRKNGNGYQAVKWFGVGNTAKVIEYCKNDVLLTYKLYEFGKKHSFLYAPCSDNTRKPIPIDWQNF